MPQLTVNPSHNICYIKFQIFKYKRACRSLAHAQERGEINAFADHQKEDALWRIASHLDLPELDQGGDLTDEQLNQMIRFVEEFESNDDRREREQISTAS
jgi:hypothetical protein